MTTIKVCDAVIVDGVKITTEGYLVAEAKVARTGTQLYYASEIGDIALQAGFKPHDVVRVYRHPDQVFSDSALKSITRVPVTVDHPTVQVTADNWSDLAVGEVGDAYKVDGDWIVVNPMIKDAAAIAAAKTTHKEISMGYEAMIVPARAGIDADFEMRDIRMNHLALVPSGRAGPEARIGDAWGATPICDNDPGVTPNHHQKGGHMTTKTVVLGDSAVQVIADDVGKVDAYKASMAKALADEKAARTAEIADKDQEIGRLKAELKAAQDAANVDVDALVANRVALVAQVKAVDASIQIEGKSDAELRKAAVVSKMGDAAVADASEDMIRGMFAAISNMAPKNPVAGVLQARDESIQDSRAAYLDRLTRKTKEG